MIVAVPLFGREVAPRFAFADRFLFAEIGERVPATLRETSVTGSCPERLIELSHLGVEVLLCGGFHRKFLPLATSVGIRVICGIGGDARTLVEAFARGEELLAPTTRRPGDGS
jgi:predicted Fe-Mo cluster-binding NifX family protein